MNGMAGPAVGPAVPGGNMAAVAPFNGYCHGCHGWGHSWKYCKKTNPNALPPPGTVASVDDNGGNPEATTAANQAAAVRPLSNLNSNQEDNRKAAPEPPKKTRFNLGGKLDALEEEEPEVKDLKQYFQDVGWNTTCHRRVSRRGWIPQELLALEEGSNNGMRKGVKGPKGLSDQGIKAHQYMQSVLAAVNPEPKPYERPAPRGYTWVSIRMTVDSGACDHVWNPELGPVDLKKLGLIRVTPAVRDGVTYGSASGHLLTNDGEAEIIAYTEEGFEIKLVMQMVGVTKPLLAVRKMCAAGNRVVFDDDGSYIEDKGTGGKTAISKENGTYAVRVWVMVPEEANRTGNSFHALEQEEEVEFDESGFTRLAKN